MAQGTKQAAKNIKVLKPLTKAEFSKLSDDQKRVMIAQDVVAQLRLDKFLATSGDYMVLSQGSYNLESFSADDLEGTDLTRQQISQIFASPDPLHTMFNAKNAPQCNVCAIGAACCSAVRLFDDASYGEDHQVPKHVSIDMWGTVGRYFSKEQQQLMEGWFERWEKTEGEDDKRYVTGITKEWRLITPADRLMAVYSDIAANKGTFNPTANWWRKHLPKEVWNYAARQKKLSEEIRLRRTRIDALQEQIYNEQDELDNLNDQYDAAT